MLKITKLNNHNIAHITFGSEGYFGLLEGGLVPGITATKFKEVMSKENRGVHFKGIPNLENKLLTCSYEQVVQGGVGSDDEEVVVYKSREDNTITAAMAGDMLYVVTDIDEEVYDVRFALVTASALDVILQEIISLDTVKVHTLELPASRTPCVLNSTSFNIDIPDRTILSGDITNCNDPHVVTDIIIDGTELKWENNLKGTLTTLDRLRDTLPVYVKTAVHCAIYDKNGNIKLIYVGTLDDINDDPFERRD